MVCMAPRGLLGSLEWTGGSPSRQIRWRVNLILLGVVAYLAPPTVGKRLLLPGNLLLQSSITVKYTFLRVFLLVLLFFFLVLK
jgi:hypothetical protein